MYDELKPIFSSNKKEFMIFGIYREKVDIPFLVLSIYIFQKKLKNIKLNSHKRVLIPFL